MTRQTPGKEEGFTLVEMMITVLILGVVLLAAFDFMDRTSKITRLATNNVQAEKDSDLALRTITQDIRASSKIGAPCGSGYATCLQVTVARPSAGTLGCSSTIKYELTGGTLVQNRTDDASCAAAVKHQYTNRQLLDVSSTTDLFTYYDKSGKSILLSTVCGSGSPCVPEARSVLVKFEVKYREQTTSPLKMESFAALRNSRDT